MDDFITAVSVATGRKHRIPSRWLDRPTFAEKWKIPPSARQDPNDRVDMPEGDPSMDWTVPQLEQYATDHDIELTRISLKADVLSAIDHPTDANPGDPNTPAAGGEQEI